MATIKSYSDLQQSKKLAEILQTESADMVYIMHATSDNFEFRFDDDMPPMVLNGVLISEITTDTLPCWSLAALLDVLPEINGANLKFERVKAEDGYDGYYYYIEYEGIILIPYSKNPVDACYEMIIRLNELNLL